MAIFYSSLGGFGVIAEAIDEDLRRSRVEIVYGCFCGHCTAKYTLSDLVSNYRFKKGWQDLYHYGYEEGTLFADLLDEVKDKVRIILIVGPLDSHLGLVEAVDELSKQNIMSHSGLKTY